MPSTIFPGDLVRITCLVKNQAETLIDPSTLTFKIKQPDLTLTTYIYGTDAQLVRDSTGTFHVDVSVTQSGLHRYRFSSTGTGQAAEESSFQVDTSSFS